MNDDGDLRDQLKKEWGKRLEDNVKGISESAVFMSMLNGKFDDPLMLMQMGIAIYLDKPIYLLVNKGTPVPDNLKKVAKGIEYVDYDDMDAMTAAVKRMQEDFEKE